MMNMIIVTENIHRDFRVGRETVRALREISFSIAAGEFVAIMGASGSGKSTLLNVLGCLDSPTTGEYFLDGVSVSNMSRNERAGIRNRKIGFVFQSYNLLPRTSALENVELPLFYNAYISNTKRKKLAQTALDAVGMADRMDHTPNQLSGGEQQRVAIARSLVNDPVIILADEATGNLDTRNSYEIMAFFQELNRDGKTIAFVTHEPDIAAFCKRSIRMRDGRIVEDSAISNPVNASEPLKNLPSNDDSED